MDLKKILFEILVQAEDGKIKIGDEELYIGFNTTINGINIFKNDINNVELEIKDIDLFLVKLNEYLLIEKDLNRKTIKYITDEEKLRVLIAYLFVNATTEDFLNPEKYIERYIGFLTDDTLDNLEEEIDLDFLNTKLLIKNSDQSVLMETPKKIEFEIKRDELSFKLPEISYGIVEENNKKVCYIYSILNKEKEGNEEIEKLKKQVYRKLYKINSNVEETEEFKNYKEGKSVYYPENISDISVTAVTSLFIFLNLIKDKVDEIKVVPYLPLRYHSREIASLNATTEVEKINRETRNDNIQKNATEKLIRTFRRVEAHVEFLKLKSYPYELDEFLTFEITKEKLNRIENDFIINLENDLKKRL